MLFRTLDLRLHILFYVKWFVKVLKYLETMQAIFSISHIYQRVIKYHRLLRYYYYAFTQFTLEAGFTY